MSPFKTTVLKLVQRYATSPTRVKLLSGLVAYRQALCGIGLVDGFQWLDGSFIEDIETSEARSPRDIDVVTFFRRPPMLRDTAAFRAFTAANLSLFRPNLTKLQYNCDAYFVDLDVSNPFTIVERTRYFFGLFSHRRSTHLWKGIVELPLHLGKDDTDALVHLRANGAP